MKKSVRNIHAPRLLVLFCLSSNWPDFDQELDNIFAEILPGNDVISVGFGS